MKIAITGVNGLLGSTLFTDAVNYGWEAIQIKRRDINNKTLDLLCKMIADINCDVLVHCAANTNVEYCELNKKKCFSDNIILTEKIAIACELNNIKFVFISSTGVYGNYQDEPYCEYDPIIPTTIHHQSKMIAENLVLNLVKKSLIIRTGWLFGGLYSMNKNFVSNRIKEAISSDGIIYSDISQRGNPTFVVDLSRNLYKLLQTNFIGVFNCVNSGSASRYEYVSEIIKLSDIPVSVLGVESSTFNREALVSHNEMAFNFKLKEFGLDEMPCWKKSLSSYINTIKDQYEK